MKYRTTPALLVVVALLLALNLAAQLPWPTAQAQQLQPDREMAMQPPPRLVGIATPYNSVMVRMWSDGVVEWRYLSHPAQWASEWQEVVPEP